MTVTYSIRMLSRLSGTSIETIRYYEKVALLPAPSRASNGFREYDNTFIGCLAFIRHGRELGFTFDEIRELLKIARYAEEPWVDADRMTRDHLDALRSEIRKLQRLWRGLKQEADYYSRKSKHYKLLHPLAVPNARCRS